MSRHTGVFVNYTYCTYCTLQIYSVYGIAQAVNLAHAQNSALLHLFKGSDMLEPRCKSVSKATQLQLIDFHLLPEHEEDYGSEVRGALGTSSGFRSTLLASMYSRTDGITNGIAVGSIIFPPVYSTSPESASPFLTPLKIGFNAHPPPGGSDISPASPRPTRELCFSNLLPPPPTRTLFCGLTFLQTCVHMHTTAVMPPEK